MKLLAARVRKLIPANLIDYVGDFISPRAYNQVGDTPVWAADNDAFSGFNPDRYRRMLDKITVAVEKHGVIPPRFITVPDVVCDHHRTLELWHRWVGELRSRGLAPAFVLQNGAETHWAYEEAGHADGFPFDGHEEGREDAAAAFFIGGDTAFKFSDWVREFVSAANYHGYWVHMGRVNSVRRMLYAKRIGCDSCDGSGMARFPTDTLIPMIHALRLEETNDLKQLNLLN